MKSGRSGVSYRSLRNDFHSHHKTAGLSPFARDLFLQCLGANIVGALQRSVRMMARIGAMSEKNVREAIAQLEERGICRHFDDLEILWLIECADEQVSNAKAWKAARGVVAQMPEPFRLAFDSRYKETVSGTPDRGGGISYPIPYPPDENQTGSSQETGDRNQESGDRRQESRAHEDRVEQGPDAHGAPPDCLAAHQWLAAFGAAWCEKYGRPSYGHSGDGRACGSLDLLLERLGSDQVMQAWEARERMFREFLSDADKRVKSAAHPFAFFVPRFSALMVSATAKRPANGRGLAGDWVMPSGVGDGL